MSLVEVAVVVVEEWERNGRVARDGALFGGQRWYGQLCACRKDPGSVQLNRLGEVTDGNVYCAVKAVVLFSSLFRLGWEEELCSVGVWLVVMGGRSAVETLTVDEQNRFCQAWPPSGSTPAAGCSRRSSRKKPQAKVAETGVPWTVSAVHWLQTQTVEVHCEVPP